MALVTTLMWWDSRKSRVTQIQQPVNITITEELHKIFAAKEDFERHVAENGSVHRDLFSKLGGMERGARSEDDKIRADLSEKFQSIQRSLGRIEGELSKR